MDQFKAGDIIEHRLMPGFTMTVLETRDCETDSNRPEPHLRVDAETCSIRCQNARRFIACDIPEVPGAEPR